MRHFGGIPGRGLVVVMVSLLLSAGGCGGKDEPSEQQQDPAAEKASDKPKAALIRERVQEIQAELDAKPMQTPSQQARYHQVSSQLQVFGQAIPQARINASLGMNADEVHADTMTKLDEIEKLLEDWPE